MNTMLVNVQLPKPAMKKHESVPSTLSHCFNNLS